VSKFQHMMSVSA